MKKRLLRLQTLIIALAVLVSFGFSGVHSLSETSTPLQLTLADQSDAVSSVEEVDCDAPGNPCQSQKDHASHAGECCPLRALVPFSKPAGSSNTLWHMARKDLTETAYRPVLRPPRFIA